MAAFKLLLRTDLVRLNLGANLFVIVMAIYMFTRFRKLMNDECGNEGWSRRPLRRGRPVLPSC